MVRLLIRNVPPLHALVRRLFPRAWKEWSELGFWKSRMRSGVGAGESYARMFTTHFGIEPDFYTDKRILDIGCGPQGSLEWADMAADRVGLDPLAKDYLKLGADRQKMRYVAACSESVPFEDAHFDVVSMFNALDHVADLDVTISGIQRVLKPGGLFLLLTDVNHDATACEPQEFSWDVARAFLPVFEILDERHYEKRGGIYETVDMGVPYEHSDTPKRPGTLLVKYRKVQGLSDGVNGGS
ncbi:MAG TPA: class I SAM-dependent methyltransferase [Planctomycetota bacterium]|nr:class I SAM-dependent methyltransferase [Planctomycetota bacterium]